MKEKTFSTEKIILSLDVNSEVSALKILETVKYTGIKIVKVNALETFFPQIITRLKYKKFEIMMDRKLADIPSTNEKYIHAFASRGVSSFTYSHYIGADLASISKYSKAKGITPIGVVQLSSISETGMDRDSENKILGNVRLCMDNGLNHLVCSGSHVNVIKSRFPESILYVPGVRMPKDSLYDQQAVLTPKKAIQAGADYLIIGRPICNSKDPAKKIQEIVDNVNRSR